MVWQPLVAHENRDINPTTGSVKLFPTSHYYPLYLSKLVHVEVSNNGQDFTDSEYDFCIKKMPSSKN